MFQTFDDLTIHPACFSLLSWERMLTALGAVVSLDFCRADKPKVRVQDTELFDSCINVRLDIRNAQIADAIGAIVNQHEVDERVVAGYNEISLSIFHVVAILRIAADLCENPGWQRDWMDEILKVQGNLVRYAHWVSRLFGLRRRVKDSRITYKFVDDGETLAVTVPDESGLRAPRYDGRYRILLTSQPHGIAFRAKVFNRGFWNWATDRAEEVELPPV